MAATERDGAVGLGDVLHVVRTHGPLTRADVALRTGLGRSTVALRLEALAERDLIRPAEGRPSTGGRPASTFAFNPSAGVVLAVELAATNAHLAVTDLDGTVLESADSAIAIADGPATVLAIVERLGGELLRALGGRRRRKPLAVGIGVPGPVEYATGRPVSPPIMPGWDGYDIVGKLAAAFDAPVLVDNGVNLMALAEHADRWQAADNLLFVKAGTGIGCAIVADGKIFRGSQGAAGEIGHIAVRDHDDVCVCGNVGCLEAVVGTVPLVRAARARGLSIDGPRDLVELVKRHDPVAVSLTRDSGRVFGEVLAALVNALNPGVVVLGGELATAEPFSAGLRELVYQRAAPLASQHLQIVPSQLGDRAGTRGAAMVAIDHALDVAALAA
jgi:predicted NBD/HSP70 family sugar kinase